VPANVTSDRARGRPREFDEDAVLEAVMRLFAEKGYEAASLADIVDAAGLNKSSLYNTFGSKEELFQRAIRRYVEQREQLLELAASGDRGLADLRGVIDLAEAESLSPEGRRGCLAVNSTAELGFASDDMVELARQYREAMRQQVRRPLERAADAGEIDPLMVDVYSETVMSFLLTAMLSARGGASEEEQRAHFGAMRRLVDSWRTS
jgi:TetR/AcrR family transcriptional repressor of nem operon